MNSSPKSGVRPGGEIRGRSVGCCPRLLTGNPFVVQGGEGSVIPGAQKPRGHHEIGQTFLNHGDPRGTESEKKPFTQCLCAFAVIFPGFSRYGRRLVYPCRLPADKFHMHFRLTFHFARTSLHVS
jgi:hypothetical protein